MSFAQEMKDFVAGFQATSDIVLKNQKVKQDAEQYRETMDFNREKLESTLADRKLSRAAAAARSKLSAGRADAAAARAERLFGLREKEALERAAERERRAKAAATRADDAALAGMVAPDAAANVPQDSAVDLPDEYDTEAEDEILLPEDEFTTDYAEGGLVVRAQTGGVMPAVEEDEKTEAVPTAAPVPLPRPRPANLTPAAPAPDAAPASSKFNAADIKATASAAAKAGMDLFEEDADKKPEKTGAVQIDPKKGAAPMDINSPEGAPTRQDIEAIDTKIDGENELQPYMKGAARLAYLYQYALDKGDLPGAKRMSARILQYNMQAARTQGTLALEALRNGNLESGAKLIADSYDNVPDGRKLDYKVLPNGTVQFSVMDGDKVVEQGVANTAQLWEQAKGIANGTEFIQRVSQLAAEEGGSSGTGKKRMTYTQATDAYGDAHAGFQKAKAAYEGFGEDDSSKERRDAYKVLEAAQKELRKAEKIARYVGDKTKRKSPDILNDLKKMRDAYEEQALPTAPPGPERTWGEWWNNKPAGSSEAEAEAAATSAATAIPAAPPGAAPAPTLPAPAQALPTAPAAPQAQAPAQGKPIPPGLMAEAEKAIKANPSKRAAIIQKLIDSGYAVGAN